jgi:hypothetical protein
VFCWISRSRGIRITGLGHARSTLSKSGPVQIYSKAWGPHPNFRIARRTEISDRRWFLAVSRISRQPRANPLRARPPTCYIQLPRPWSPFQFARKDTQRPDHPTIFTGLQIFGGRPEQGQPYIGSLWHPMDELHVG